MTPTDFIRVTSASASPMVNRALRTLLTPLKDLIRSDVPHVAKNDTWTVEHKATGQGQRHARITIYGEFTNDPDDTGPGVELTIVVRLTGTVVFRLDTTGGNDPPAPFVAIDPTDQQQLNGWLALVVYTIQRHCPPPPTPPSYFV